MGQVVLTINAGSSSVKFAIFAYGGGGFDELARGQVEGLGASATFTAKRTSGAKTQFNLDPGKGAADHRAAMKAILRWLGDEKLDSNVVAVGHRVLHGGRDFTQTGAGRRRVDRHPAHRHSARRAARAVQHPRHRGGDRSVPRRRRRSPVSTPPSTAPSRSSPTSMVCRAPITTKACAATGFTACPTNTSRGG